LNPLRQKLSTSPALARVLPFALFLALTFFQDRFNEDSRYWIYLLKTVIGAWTIWLICPFVSETRWKLSWEAVGIGIAVFAIWVGLDSFTPKLFKPGATWNPHSQFGENTMLAWFFVVVRIVGSTFVVSSIEEIFYRSFLYRYIKQTDFLSVPPNHFDKRAFIAVSLFFGFAHGNQWLAGILCGLAFQWLVIRKNYLGDALTAHAVTNLLLGIWVVWKDAWNFW